jgi:hypothetical protein
MKLAAYLIYCIVWDLGIIAGGAYVVFWRGRSGWWLLLALLITSAGGFSNDTFRDLSGLPKEKKDA